MQLVHWGHSGSFRGRRLFGNKKMHKRGLHEKKFKWAMSRAGYQQIQEKPGSHTSASTHQNRPSWIEPGFCRISRRPSDASPSDGSQNRGRVDVIWSSYLDMVCVLCFSSLSLEECHNILPCKRASTPLTEPVVQISRIRLFSMLHSTVDGQYNLCSMCGTGKG